MHTLSERDVRDARGAGSWSAVAALSRELRTLRDQLDTQLRKALGLVKPAGGEAAPAPEETKQAPAAASKSR